MPRNKYPEETVKKILDTSLRLFVEKGFEQTTVLDIVNNLGGLTRGAFYHHFKSKDEVLEAIFNRNDEGRSLVPRVKDIPTANGRERLMLALKMGLNSNFENEENAAVTTLAVSLLSNPRFLAEHIKGVKFNANEITPLLEAAMADGSLKKGNAKILAEVFMLLVNVWMMPNIFPCDAKEQREKAELIIKMFAGLGYDFLDGELKQLFFDVMEKFGV